MKAALEHLDEIERRLDGKNPAIFLDYDGTLSPIAPRPEMATFPEETREIVRRLAERFPVAILSGRAREDVAELVGLEGITYAGSHGFDIAGPGVRYEGGDGIPEQIESAAQELREKLPGLPGILIEPKHFTVAVHFRLAHPEDLAAIDSVVDEVVANHPTLYKMRGRKVFEVRPRLNWNKGKALLWLMEALRLDPAYFIPLYLGDDVTDEDAFLTLEAQGIGILVAEEPRPTAASYSLSDPNEVRRFLSWLAERSISKGPGLRELAAPGR